MTGKELKTWAATIPDDAEIQHQKDQGYSFARWIPFETTFIRAYKVFISSPTITESIIDETKQEEPTL